MDGIDDFIGCNRSRLGDCKRVFGLVCGTYWGHRMPFYYMLIGTFNPVEESTFILEKLGRQYDDYLNIRKEG